VTRIPRPLEERSQSNPHARHLRGPSTPATGSVHASRTHTSTEHEMPARHARRCSPAGSAGTTLQPVNQVWQIAVKGYHPQVEVDSAPEKQQTTRCKNREGAVVHKWDGWAKEVVCALQVPSQVLRFQWHTRNPVVPTPGKNVGISSGGYTISIPAIRYRIWLLCYPLTE
jgi:hypothetical protein